MAIDHEAAFESATALMVLDENLEVLGWNESAEALTGIPAADAIGRACWQVVAGIDDAGGTVCHSGCAGARLMREGHCVPTQHLSVRTADGRRRISLDMVTVKGTGRPVYLHLMRDAPPPLPRPAGPRPRLTRRQREILVRLADGQPAKVVAARLGLTETTVRNHIRLLFLALGAHSQLEAVARARRFELI